MSERDKHGQDGMKPVAHSPVLIGAEQLASFQHPQLLGSSCGKGYCPAHSGDGTSLYLPRDPGQGVEGYAMAVAGLRFSSEHLSCS